jgi:hypothetical protein
MKGLGSQTMGRGGLNKRKREGWIQVPSYLPFVFKIVRQKLVKHKRPSHLIGYGTLSKQHTAYTSWVAADTGLPGLGLILAGAVF